MTRSPEKIEPFLNQRCNCKGGVKYDRFHRLIVKDYSNCSCSRVATTIPNNETGKLGFAVDQTGELGFEALQTGKLGLEALQQLFSDVAHEFCAGLWPPGVACSQRRLPHFFLSLGFAHHIGH